MKRIDKVKKEAEKTMEKIRSITRHIRNVQDNCLLLGEKLIDKGEIDCGLKLIANGFQHDISKFGGIEWEHMSCGELPNHDGAKLKMKLAIHQHNTTNPHHPEFWHGIKNMPRVYLAEFCCDVKSRSEEFGTSLKEWIDDSATKRWGFTKEDKVYKEIMEFVDLLCDRPFTAI
jgi:hypothetical protein